LVVSLFLVLGPVHLHQARAAGVEEQRLLEIINGYRQENGVGTLVPSAVLSTSATRHSEDMAAHDFFSHSTKESSYYPSGSSPADRAAREGYPLDVYTAENIARGQLTAEEVFEDWRGSPEHDAAMLGEQYTAAGIGTRRFLLDRRLRLRGRHFAGRQADLRADDRRADLDTAACHRANYRRTGGRRATNGR
jgi:hypothetical protein